MAAIAQLGERQTEDLKVPGSIPGLGTHLFTVLGVGLVGSDICWCLCLRNCVSARVRAGPDLESPAPGGDALSIRPPGRWQRPVAFPVLLACRCLVGSAVCRVRSCAPGCACWTVGPVA
jgi:hypothetical protein